MFLLRDLPRNETLAEQSKRYPNIEPAGIDALLVMLRVASDVLAAIESYLAQHGLSQGRFTVLMILNRDPSRGMNPSDLARRAGVTRATMTGLLDGLENDDLVERRRHPIDRRMLTVHLTERGRMQLDGMLPDYFSRINGLMDGLGIPERRELSEMLRQVHGGIERIHTADNGKKGHELNQAAGRQESGAVQ